MSAIGVRARMLLFFVFAATILLAARLAYLQVFRHGYYRVQAANQNLLVEELAPKRGTIYFQDYETNSLVPAALSQDLGFVFAVPSEMLDVGKTVETLVEVLGLRFDEGDSQETAEANLETTETETADDEPHIVGTELDAIESESKQVPAPEPVEDKGPSEYERFVARLSDKSDPYEPVKRGVPEEALSRLRELDLPGISYTRDPSRLYPELGIGGHVLGFVGRDEQGNPVGRYGIEGYFEEELAGAPGRLETRKDVAGRFVGVGERVSIPSVNGADIVLTIDRTIQFVVCKALRQAVMRHEADGGSVVVMDPQTGDILAMCGYPDFDPGSYGDTEEIKTFNNPVTFGAYEPGSVFKSITMAAALDTETVTPSSTFEDTGEVKVGIHTIRNSDRKAHGVVTMTEALEESLNTGMAYLVGEIGYGAFESYVRAFGFGEKVGLEIDTEAVGDVSSLEKEGDIFSITASFGQGITVTPLQLLQAYAAIANGGVLMKPRLVREMRYADGYVERFEGRELRRVLSGKTARLLGAMLVSVVEQGHGKRAGVDGYYIAGKTGTAQVAKDGAYSATETIGSFAGFGPVENPRFVMVTRIDNPKNVSFAESTAAPLFGELADFLLEYLDVAPSR